MLNRFSAVSCWNGQKQEFAAAAVAAYCHSATYLWNLIFRGNKNRADSSKGFKNCGSLIKLFNLKNALLFNLVWRADLFFLATWNLEIAFHAVTTRHEIRFKASVWLSPRWFNKSLYGLWQGAYFSLKLWSLGAKLKGKFIAHVSSSATN